jgi:mannitol/fructose-specific phosphotransferase system IIA component (Ntr-type)
MKLRDFFTAEAVSLNLESESKDDLLREMVALLELDPKSEAILFKTLKRRENLGSTGIGKGIAIPHCRSLVVNRLRLAYGRKPDGVDFNAIDGQPVYNLFLIVAPPLEVSNQYLPVLGKIAQFAKDPDVPTLLSEISTPSEFLRLLEDKGS